MFYLVKYSSQSLQGHANQLQSILVGASRVFLGSLKFETFLMSLYNHITWKNMLFGFWLKN